jgi:hypothetical protein
MLTIISRWILPIIRNISDKSFRGFQNTQYNFNNVSWRLCSLRDNVEEHCRIRQAEDDNITRRMRFACWKTQSYRFSTATMVKRTHLKVTLMRQLPVLFLFIPSHNTVVNIPLFSLRNVSLSVISLVSNVLTLHNQPVPCKDIFFAGVAKLPESCPVSWNYICGSTHSYQNTISSTNLFRSLQRTDVGSNSTMLVSSRACPIRYFWRHFSALSL